MSEMEQQRYRLGVQPTRELAPHNDESWRAIVGLLTTTETASFDELAGAVVGHVSGDRRKPGPRNFVRYCVRRGWLRPV